MRCVHISELAMKRLDPVDQSEGGRAKPIVPWALPMAPHEALMGRGHKRKNYSAVPGRFAFEPI